MTDYSKLTFTGSRRGTKQDPLHICLREVKNGNKRNGDGKGKRRSALRVYIPLPVLNDCGWDMDSKMAWAVTASENALIIRPVKEGERGLKFHCRGGCSGKAYIEITGLGQFARENCNFHYADDEYLVIYLDEDPD